MLPSLLFYANLVLCGLVFIELLITFKKNPPLKVYLLLIIASLFAMNYFALAGVETRKQFVFVKCARLFYVGSTLLALIHLVQSKIPRWFIALLSFAAVTVTTLRLVYYDQINIESLPNSANPVFTVGIEFYSPKPMARVVILALSITSIIVAYYYYRRLLLKLNYESVQHKQLSRWIISLVVPFFMLTIFGILGNLRVFPETLSSYLFAFFSCTAICSFLLRPRFLDKRLKNFILHPDQ